MFSCVLFPIVRLLLELLSVQIHNLLILAEKVTVLQLRLSLKEWEGWFPSTVIFHRINHVQSILFICKHWIHHFSMDVGATCFENYAKNIPFQRPVCRLRNNKTLSWRSSSLAVCVGIYISVCLFGCRWIFLAWREFAIT